MMHSSKIFVCLAVFALALAGGNAEKLHIGIYYESLCPDSVRFIQQQLLPNFAGFRDYIDVLFVPHGKSVSVNGGESFICQHGEAECIGNIIQSCTLYLLTGQPDAKMAFVGCQMSFPYPEDNGKLCAAHVEVDHNEVLQCFNGGLGTQLQLEAERLTRKIAEPYPSFVPTIVYDHEFSDDLQKRTLTNFHGVVCELIGYAAPACEEEKL